MAFPYMNYIFIPYGILLICYFALKSSIYADIPRILLPFIKVFWPFILLVLAFLIAFLIEKDKNILIIKDVIHAIVISVLIFIGVVLIDKRQENFRYFVYRFEIQIIIVSCIISIAGLSKFLLALSGYQLHSERFPLFNTSLSNDYNFYCLSAILGMIATLHILYTSKGSRLRFYLLQILLFIFSITIIFSNSRRGIIFYTIFFIGFSLFNIFIFFKPSFSRFGTSLYLILKFIFLLLMGFYIATYNSQIFSWFKRSTFSVNYLSKSIYPTLYRYSSVLNLTKQDFDRILSIKPDPKYPYTLWGTRIHTEVFPLSGNNVEIVPAGAVGYKLDRTCNADTWNNNAYAYTRIGSLFSGDTLINKTKDYYASVYCYVSYDFSGSWARIAAEGNVKGNLLAIYDLTKKGVWQKLEINFECEKGLAPVHLYMANNGAQNFRDMNGYVIFAYPEYKKSDQVIELKQSTYLLNEKNPVLSATLFSFDLLKNFVKSVKSARFTDKTERQISYEGSDITTSRIVRWRYAYEIYVNEYSLAQKIFGGGFTYMNKFGTRFGESELDYPHNPFIDAFLYSGLIGGLIYLWFMVLVFFYYIKYRKHHLFFLICFIIVFLFSFVSGNTHFSIPVFTFLSLIPFFTKYNVETE